MCRLICTNPSMGLTTIDKRPKRRIGSSAVRQQLNAIHAGNITRRQKEHCFREFVGLSSALHGNYL